MVNFKPWFLSKTIWSSSVAGIVSVASLFGIAVDSGDQTALTEAILQSIAAISSLIAIFGRIKASARIF